MKSKQARRNSLSTLPDVNVGVPERSAPAKKKSKAQPKTKPRKPMDALCDECNGLTDRVPCQNPHMDTGVLCGSIICAKCDEDGHPSDGFCDDCQRGCCGGCFGVRSFDEGTFASYCNVCKLPWFQGAIDKCDKCEGDHPTSTCGYD